MILKLIITRYKIDFELFGYSPDEYISWGKLSQEEIEEEARQKAEAAQADLKADDEVVNPDNLQLNVIKTDDKENDIDNEILTNNEIKEVKTILSDDEKLPTGSK